jgi:hypothetical protein
VTLKTSTGKLTVVFTDDTKVQQPKGLGLRKKRMSATALIPELKVSVGGVGDAESRLVARSIAFSGDDLQAAETMQAELASTQEAVETNKHGAMGIGAPVASNETAQGRAKNHRVQAGNDAARETRVAESALGAQHLRCVLILCL